MWPSIDNIFRYFLAVNVLDVGNENCNPPAPGHSVLYSVPRHLNIPSIPSIPTSCRSISNSTLRIEGDYVKFSYFLQSNRTCYDLFKNKIITKLDVFALNQVDLDIDLNEEGREFDVTIITPILHVIDNRKINLKGTDARIIDTKAVESKPGDPGLSGNPGGNFIVVAGKIISNSYLDVDTRGGNGCDGQDGGDGKNSSSGYSGKVRKIQRYCTINQCVDNMVTVRSEKSTYDRFNCTPIFSMLHSYYTNGDTFAGTYTFCRAKVFKPFTPAENGGDGGKGGEAGKPGKSVILQIGGDTSFVKHESQSFDGKAGAAGKKGIGGSKHGPIQIFDGMFNFFNHDAQIRPRKLVRTIQPEDIAPDGQDGIDGGNTKGFIPAKPAREPRAGHTINEYMSFMLQHFKAGGDKKNTFFLQELCRNDSAGALYDTFSLTEEFMILEENLFFLKREINILPCYQSLLTRISNYAVTSVVQNSLQEKKLLSYLYTATLSKIRNLNDYSEARLVIDLPKYLIEVKENINNLKNLKNEGDKLATVMAKMQEIEAHREEYKKKLDDKIQEASNLAEKFQPEIREVEKEIDELMKKLLKDIKDLQNATEKEIKAMEKKREEMKRQLVIKAIFGVIGVLSTFLLFLGPIGIAAAAVIGTVSAVTQSMVLSGGTQPNMKKVQESFKNTQKMVSEIQKVKKERLIKFLDQLSAEAKNSPAVSEEVALTVETYKERLTHIHSLSECEATKKQLLTELEKKRANLIKKEGERYDKAVKVLDKFVKAAQVTEAVYDLYQTISNDKKQIDNFDAAIEASKHNLQLLKTLEASFNEVIIPSIRDMEADFNKVINNIKGKSRSSLVMTKWNVQKKLRKMKKQLKESAAALPSSSEVDNTMQKLEDIMESLVNIFDLIQGYEEGKDFADYIADLISDSANDINMTNYVYEENRRRLDVIISSNVILQEYGSVVNSFKQFSFPMAYRYFSNFLLPSQLELKNNINDFVTTAIEQMTRLNSKYDKYMSAHFGKVDDCIYKANFSSGRAIMGPFYRWSRKEDKKTMLKLLSGEEVTVMIDVKRSPTVFDAIKFQLVKLDFKIKNESLQSEIDKILNLLEISMSHLGDSHYRFNNKIYRITTDIVNIVYSYEENPNTQEPISHSSSWDKLQRGEFMLSPYAVWKIKLSKFPVNPSKYKRLQKMTMDPMENETAYDNLKAVNSAIGLEKYIDDIVIELAGRGSFTRNDRNDGCMDFPVDEYYEPIEVLPNKTNLLRAQADC